MKIVLDILEPLKVFYQEKNLKPLDIQPLPGASLPQPYRQLLFHCNDMTPTLQNFHQASIVINAIAVKAQADYFLRMVTLVTENGQKVEFGAIKINLAIFPKAAREVVLACQRPLGLILADFKMAHYSEPLAFFSVDSDSFIEKHLGLAGQSRLYGRINLIRDGDDRELVEVIEILPPLPFHKNGERNAVP